MTKRNEQHIFNKYDTAVRDIAGELTKARAIELSNRQSSRVVPPAAMRQLYESLKCSGWEHQVGTNWFWRYKEPGATDSDEVLLERAIAKIDERLWACQMSTSSGVEGPYLHRRRAIDLVRFIKPCHFAFVELKVDSDNPLYAAFELLGYALAYLHARTNDWTGCGYHDVFKAERIELTILGPEDWYRHGRDKKLELNLDWLAEEITESLNDFVTAEASGKPIFTMKFRQFSGTGRDQQAMNVDLLAMNWNS